MVEKPGIKIIDFDDFVFFTTESKLIFFNKGLFLEYSFSQHPKPLILEEVSFLLRLFTSQMN